MTDHDAILMSAPDVGAEEREALLRAFDSGWIAPVGPELAAFEDELVAYTGNDACVALSSGTAALHLALVVADVKPGDEVIVQSATFAASAFAVAHAGATPIFIDSEWATWCLDPELLAAFLKDRAATGTLPKAVMPVDLYGSLADYAAIRSACEPYAVAVIRDGAEALGSKPPSVEGPHDLTALSFNGNKIITTSGGGALLGQRDAIDRARFLSTQARLPELHYQHEDIGFNYRMSNLLAAVGRAQLAGLEVKVERRTAINERYRRALPDLEWCAFGATQRPNHWLSVALLPEGIGAATVCNALDAEHIQARPAWKPMHQQPVFASNEIVGGAVANELFRRGICLPSGSGLTDDQVDRVIASLTRELNQ